jgi:NAD(P)H-quinone oxidoreductase subunit 5
MTPLITVFQTRTSRSQTEWCALLTGVAWVLFLFTLTIGVSCLASGQAIELSGLLRFDALAAVMAILVTLVSALVHSFSQRYMAGDRRVGTFFCKLTAITVLVLLTVSAEHVLILVAAWLTMGLLLASLMGHVKGWLEAQEAANLARRTFVVGALCLAVAVLLLGWATGQWTMTGILASVSQGQPSSVHYVAAALVIVAAMVQSAQWPFHRWLIGSMNSPTPVSALMHAGLVNAGGFLLARFAPVFTASPTMMTVIFTIGAVSALLGTAWMLVQSDIKRTLGCSTMGQMGFMVMQCGLGFFTAAIAHLVMHGLFKAALFLGAGSAVQDTPVAVTKSADAPSISKFSQLNRLAVVILPALLAAAVFALLTGKSLYPTDGGAMLVAFAFLAALQAGLSIPARDSRITPSHLLGITLLLVVSAALYAAGFDLIHGALASLPSLTAPQSWTLFDTFALLLFAAGWLVLALRMHAVDKDIPAVMLWLYVTLLNASQPKPHLITALRKNYRPS